MATGSFKLPIGGATSDPDAWVRPTDWLTMPTIGTQEFIGLLAITDDESNHIALNCAGAYTVDWGDGTSENVATGVQANKSYTYSAISSGTFSTRGYKQVLVRVTPQAGQNLTTVNLNVRNPLVTKTIVSGWIELAVNGSNITTFTTGNSSTQVGFGMVEKVNIGTIGTITSFRFFFQGFFSLQDVNLFNTASGTNFEGFFKDCYKIKTVPLFDVSLGTSFLNAFLNCYSLRQIPLFSLKTTTNISCSNMFQNCYSLKEVPLLNTIVVTNFTSMFQGCSYLQTIPLFNTIAGTNFGGMFQNCYNLQAIPLLNTIAGTNFATMFFVCNSLQVLPNLNTAAGTNFTNMLSGTTALAKGAFQGTRYSISYADMQLSQSAIVDIFNGLGTAVGTPTVNVSSNPGRAALTAGEILIATAKGWIVV